MPTTRPALRAVPAAFAAALDDDLRVPQALAVVHEAVRRATTRWRPGTSARRGEPAGRGARHARRARARPAGRATGPTAGPDDDLRAVVDALVTVALQQRQAARERKDYAAADAIRTRLRRRGRAHRGHPARPALGAEPMTTGGRRGGPVGGRPHQVRQAQARDRRLRQAHGWRARARPRPRTCGPGTRPSGGRQAARPADRRAGHGGTARGSADGRSAEEVSPERARGAGDAPEVVAGRNAVLESLRARVPATALYVGPRLDADQRVSEADPAGRGRRASRWSRPGGPSWTGSPAARCTRDSR